MFVSKVKIFVRAGSGGKGVVSFRREKFVPFGGPNGGDGGKGGDIVFIADRSINTLAYFKYHRHFFAENGEGGSGSNCNGRYGKDLVITVPVGTNVFDAHHLLLASLQTHKESIIVFKGGEGGVGNGRMATSTNRAPTTTIPPVKCEMQELLLVLTLKTDVGILGAPNAGKSSLTNCLSRANSVVGDYEFTTLNPVLGQIYDTQISLMDLPGIIEGANLGRGKGLEFLRHSEQCKMFIHLVDISNKPHEAYNMILNELYTYGNQLINTPSIIVLNKMDLVSPLERERIQKEFDNSICISTVTGEGIEELKQRIIDFFPQEEVKMQEVEEKGDIIITYDEEKDEISWSKYYTFLHKVGKKILEYKGENRGFSVVLANSPAMIKYNELYRNKPYDTNVLSLELEDSPAFLGEIILCYNKIYEEYKLYKPMYSSFEEYLSFIYIHGILHLFGFDHMSKEDEELMEEQESLYLELLREDRLI